MAITTTNQKLNELKAHCGTLLANNNKKHTTSLGSHMVLAFWVGAMRADPELAAMPFVNICLMSGRYADLVTMPTATKE